MIDTTNQYTLSQTSEDKVFFTLFKSVNTPIVKSYTADFTKKSGADISLAKYYTQNVASLEALDAYLKKLTPYDCIVMGMTKEIVGISRSRSQIEKGKTGIYRGKEHIKLFADRYPDNASKREYSLFFIDVDAPKIPLSHFRMDTAQEVRESLIALIPPLEQVGMLIRPSSSAGIYHTQTMQELSKDPSWHVYFLVANHFEETNAALKELIKRRAWRDDINLAYVVEDGVGVRDKYYVDLAVFSAERIIIESSPILVPELAKRDIESTLFEGGILNLATIDYSNEPTYAEVMNKRKSELQPERVFVPSPAKALMNTTKLIPTTETKTIWISSSIEESIVGIYEYLKSSDKPDYKEFLNRCNGQVVTTILTFLGYDIGADYKFRIRKERTPSASIASNGWIKDFGGDFSGNIIAFLQEIFNLSFVTSWRYLQNCFGKKLSVAGEAYMLLPDPSEFERSLQIN